MLRYAWNKVSREVKRGYFELIRSGRSGSEVPLRVGVSLSCRSLWLIDAGRVAFTDAPRRRAIPRQHWREAAGDE